MAISVKAIKLANSLSRYFARQLGLDAPKKKPASYFVNADEDHMSSRAYYNNPDALTGCRIAINSDGSLG